ncbi:MAG: STT3 domain-containing protein [Candidatus Woesearchaeota archaeon]
MKETKDNDAAKRKNRDQDFDDDTDISNDEFEDDEDLNVDFSSIKKVFSSNEKKEDSKRSRSDDSDDFDDEFEDEDFGSKKENFSNKHAGFVNKKDLNRHGKEHFSKKENLNYFKKEKDFKKEHHKKREDDEELEIDFSKIKSFFLDSRRNTWLIILFLLLIPIIITIYIRLQPQYLPVTDQWAENSVYTYYRNSIAQAVNSQYPNLPQQNKNALIDTEFNKFLSENSNEVQQQIKSTSEFFKEGFRYEENGYKYTFLGDLDSYYFLRQARNLELKGSICDKVIEGKCIDDHMIAPNGLEIAITMHPYGIFYLYKILKVFMPSINLMKASFLLPTFLAIIAVIAAFFIGRRLMNNVAGFFTAMFVTLNPIFITRTLGSDTDIWNVMFPLLIVWVFLEVFEAKSILKKVILTVLVGFFIGIFSFAWSGWWYVFDFIVGALIAYIAFIIIRSIYRKQRISITRNRELMLSLLVIGILLVSSAFFVTIFTSWASFIGAVTSPIIFIATLKLATQANLWPNVLTTVAELNPASIDQIIGQVSYNMHWFFGLALLGLILILVKRKPEIKEYVLIVISLIVFLFVSSTAGLSIGITKFMIILIIPIFIALIFLVINRELEVDVKPTLLFIIWFIGMIYTSTKGIRFVLLLIPVFSIAIGVFLGYFYQWVSRLLIEKVKLSKYVSHIGIFLLICLLLITPINVGISAGKSFIPSITKGWYDSLIKIRDESKPDAIINSWWDFGHWFKYFADRRVTLDGASQNHPNAHWLGKILQTDNEKEAIAILRMLDCGSNNAFEVIDEKYNDTLLSVTLVKKIIMMDSKEEINDILSKEGFTKEQIQKILNYMKCNPPENYFISSEDMVGKAGVWAHFGLWDFKKSYIIVNLRNKMPEEAINIMTTKLNYSLEDAKKIYYEMQTLSSEEQVNAWISPWPGYLSRGSAFDCNEDNNTKLIVCNYGIGIGNQNGKNIVIEKGLIDIENIQNTTLLLGFYESSTGIKIGESTAKPAGIVIFENEKNKRYNINYSSLGYDIVLSIKKTVNLSINQTPTIYKSLISSEELSQSIFTRLFYLEGVGTTKFEKFSDITDITGQRIIVWKVNWN